ncbi:MAG TPA: ABC transporter permease subunit [Spirochaetales bacterium]|nr:ABC transporter permease subunit [Spirochaetales bacterium]HRY55287.1 ABC transporter permease subunit [Spirochaetia bacterium]HRZ63621.1 ABC transporter permease subunit [Spirochaetia bacterium]
MSSIEAPPRGRSALGAAARLARRHWQLYLILLLPLAYVALFNYLPMYGAQLAFKRFSASKGIAGSPWVGLRYFKLFFASPSSLRIILNTLSISLYSIAVNFLFPIILAVALNESRRRAFRKAAQMITYAPYFISTVVMVGLILQVLDPRLGIVPRLVAALGGGETNLMGSPKAFQSIYVWSGLWQGIGYSAIIYLAALAGVSPELQEAAIIDGCSRGQRIRHVDIPAIMPTIVIMLILSFGFVMSVGFEKVYLMQNDMNLSSSEIISTYVYKVGLVNADFGFATAIGLFNSLVNLALLVCANAAARRAGQGGLW